MGTIVPTVPSVERTYKLYRQDITARDLVAGSTTIISTPDGMFAPNSGVSIGGQSEPVSIADVMADANGAIHWVGMLPRALAGGVHLLTATGYGTDGTPIQLQQFVTVFSSEAAKTNANMCDAIHHWYRDDGYDVCSNSAETVVSAPSSSKGKVAISTKNSTNLPQLSIESSSIAANSLSEKETTRGGSNVATTTITTSSSDTSVNFGTVIVITLGILGVVGILVMVVKILRKSKWQIINNIRKKTTSHSGSSDNIGRTAL